MCADMITRINHITINVLNQKQSDIFYSQIFHFEKLESVDMDDSCITYYALLGQPRLELINYPAADLDGKASLSWNSDSGP